jgi:RNA-binding motif X-linked protein 2
MNPLTQIKNTQKITKKEIELGLFEKASWHDRYKHSAYIFAGGLDFDLTEGDLLAVFAQYGELVDVHLVRDKASGKSRGFAFLAYEDQRSTVLAVDNLNGATVAGRKVRVEHVDNYKKRKAEVGGMRLCGSSHASCSSHTHARRCVAAAAAAAPRCCFYCSWCDWCWGCYTRCCMISLMHSTHTLAMLYATPLLFAVDGRGPRRDPE